MTRIEAWLGVFALLPRLFVGVVVFALLIWWVLPAARPKERTQEQINKDVRTQLDAQTAARCREFARHELAPGVPDFGDYRSWWDEADQVHEQLDFRLVESSAHGVAHCYAEYGATGTGKMHAYLANE